MMTDDPLAQARQLIEEGRKDEAAALIMQYMSQNPDDPRFAWAIDLIMNNRQTRWKLIRHSFSADGHAKLQEFFDKLYVEALEQGNLPPPAPESAQVPPPIVLSETYFKAPPSPKKRPSFRIFSSLMSLIMVFTAGFLFFGGTGLFNESQQHASITRALAATNSEGQNAKTQFYQGEIVYIRAELETSRAVDVRMVLYGIYEGQHDPIGSTQLTNLRVFMVWELAEDGRSLLAEGNYMVEIFLDGNLATALAFVVLPG